MDDVEQILKLSRSLGNPRIYGVGCTDKSGISIVEQQDKALTLAWALINSKTLSRRSRVAIVGGGFSGITLAVALASKLKCQVEVFEAENDVVPVLAKSMWRWVCPFRDYLDDLYYSKETNLPFLNWDADYGWKVAREIRREWKLKSKELGIKSHFQTRVHLADTSSGRPTLKTKDGARRFDAIFLATGFGSDRASMKGQLSYWDSGNPKDYVPLKKRRETVFVSGCGDGGLIEIFQHCIDDFYHDEIVAYYAPLHGNSLKHFQHCLDNFKKEMLRLKYETEPDLKTRREIAKTKVRLAKNYSRFLTQLNHDKDYFKQIRQATSKKFEVYLNGLGETPFDIDREVNPFHLILLSALMRAKAFTYIQGDVVSCRRNKEGRTRLILKGGDTSSVVADRYFVRRGPDSKFKSDFPSVVFGDSLDLSDDGETTRIVWRDLIRRKDFLKDFFKK